MLAIRWLPPPHHSRHLLTFLRQSCSTFHVMSDRGQAYSVWAKTSMALLTAVIALGHPA